MFRLLRFSLVLVGVLSASALSAKDSFKPVESGYVTRTFNDLIRGSHPNFWGNFNLDPLIRPGAIGVIDLNSGVFQFSGEYLEGAEVLTSPLSEVMKLSTKHVRESKMQGSAQGTANEVGNAEVKVNWSFEKQGAMASRWVLKEKLSLKDTGRIILKNIDQLRALADSDGMYDDETGISQGFGVITSVLMAKGGMNIASLSKNASFSVSGQASAMRSMLSQASGNAGYSSVETNGNLLSFIWPDEESNNNAGLVPVAFMFASLEGERLIMPWIRPVNAFRLIFNNYGDHYVTIKVNYSCSTGPQEAEVGLLPFLKREVDNIPLDATNVNVSLDYMRLQKTVQNHRWKTPLGAWPTGDRHIDIKGSWPMYPSFYIREEAFSSK